MALVEQVGDHVTFLVLTENFNRAVSIFDVHFQLALTSASHSTRFGFYLTAWFLFRELAAHFDARNENAYFSRRIENKAALTALSFAYPIGDAEHE